ncbi:MAG: hypothetical protein IT423_11915 [Pirellulaceae bacterium]|nr:hypothetical protein [Pirellulaceae bacterium]
MKWINDWLLPLIGGTLLAFPFWAAWTCSGFGSRYFDFLPLAWQQIGLADCVFLFAIVAIIRHMLYPRGLMSHTFIFNNGPSKQPPQEARWNTGRQRVKARLPK